jgi:hypothetical protein
MDPNLFTQLTVRLPGTALDTPFRELVHLDVKSEPLPNPTKMPAGDLPDYCKQPRLKGAFGRVRLLRFVHGDQFFLANVFDFACIDVPPTG